MQISHYHTCCISNWSCLTAGLTQRHDGAISVYQPVTDLWHLRHSRHEQPKVLLLTLMVWQGREAAALEMSQWKLVPEFNVSVTILLQHRGEPCGFPGFKGEERKAPFQCWAFLLCFPLMLAFPTKQQTFSLLWSTGCFPLWEMHSADRGCNPTLCNKAELGLTSREQAGCYRRLLQSVSVLTWNFPPSLSLQPRCIPALSLQQLQLKLSINLNHDCCKIIHSTWNLKSI